MYEMVSFLVLVATIGCLRIIAWLLEPKVERENNNISSESTNKDVDLQNNNNNNDNNNNKTTIVGASPVTTEPLTPYKQYTYYFTNETTKIVNLRVNLTGPSIQWLRKIMPGETRHIRPSKENKFGSHALMCEVPAVTVYDDKKDQKDQKDQKELKDKKADKKKPQDEPKGWMYTWTPPCTLFYSLYPNEDTYDLRVLNTDIKLHYDYKLYPSFFTNKTDKIIDIRGFGPESTTEEKIRPGERRKMTISISKDTSIAKPRTPPQKKCEKIALEVYDSEEISFSKRSMYKWTPPCRMFDTIDANPEFVITSSLDNYSGKYQIVLQK